MHDQTTEASAPASIAEQRAAFDFLQDIAAQASGLPPAYVTVYDHALSICVRLADAPSFEHWRIALAIEPTAVDLFSYHDHAWVSGRTLVEHVRVELTADVPVAPHLAAVTPQADAERRYRVAQLDAQRHETDDPAEPPLAVRVAEVRPLAGLQGGVA